MNEKEATPKWAKWGVDFVISHSGVSSDFTKFYRSKSVAKTAVVWRKFLWNRKHYRGDDTNVFTATLFPVIWKGSRVE